MGFCEASVREALKRTRNNQAAAVSILKMKMPKNKDKECSGL